jgi:hypothetical protein
MSDKDRYEDLKAILFFTPILNLLVSFGVFGEDAKKALDEYAAEIGRGLLLVFMNIVIVVNLIWLFGLVFGFW